MSTVTVRTIEAGLPPNRTGYGFGWRTFRRRVEPLLCLVDYTDIEASYVTINARRVTVYRRVGLGDMWTSDYESVTRYATLRNQ